MRRNVLVGWMLLIPTDKTFLRHVVGLLLSIASLSLLLSINPYVRAEDNVLAACCQLALVFMFIGAGYTRLFHEFELVTSKEVVQRIMVFSSTTAVTLPLVIVALAIMVLLLWIMAYLIRKEGLQRSIYLVSTNAPPLLTLKEGQKWHIFLSHVWSTGQECAPRATYLLTNLLYLHTNLSPRATRNLA